MPPSPFRQWSLVLASPCMGLMLALPISFISYHNRSFRFSITPRAQDVPVVLVISSLSPRVKSPAQLHHPQPHSTPHQSHPTPSLFPLGTNSLSPFSQKTAPLRSKTRQRNANPIPPPSLWVVYSGSLLLLFLLVLFPRGRSARGRSAAKIPSLNGWKRVT